jgi:hypothetical protein
MSGGGEETWREGAVGKGLGFGPALPGVVGVNWPVGWGCVRKLARGVG